MSRHSIEAILQGREWSKGDGATSEALAKLKGTAPAPLPEAYLDLLSFGDGGEGPLPVEPFWFVLYSAEESAKIEQGAEFGDFFPGLFVIGGNGGGEAIALDLTIKGRPPVVYFDMTNIDRLESVRPLAPDFEAFADLIGKPDE